MVGEYAYLCEHIKPINHMATLLTFKYCCLFLIVFILVYEIVLSGPAAADHTHTYSFVFILHLLLSEIALELFLHVLFMLTVLPMTTFHYLSFLQLSLFLTEYPVLFGQCLLSDLLFSYLTLSNGLYPLHQILFLLLQSKLSAQVYFPLRQARFQMHLQIAL